MPMRALEDFERQLHRQLRFIELKRGAIGRRIGWRLRDFEQKNLNRDEFRFIRSLIEKPLTVGAVAPSGKALARVMANYVDPAAPGPIVELGPGTGPVTEALIERGIDPARLTLVEYDPEFCRLLRQRFPGGPCRAGRCLQSRADARRRAARAGGGLRVGPAAVQQAAQDAARPARPGVRPDEADAPFVQFTYNAILADPALARPRPRRGVGARVAKLPARPRVGIPDRAGLDMSFAV